MVQKAGEKRWKAFCASGAWRINTRWRRCSTTGPFLTICGTAIPLSLHRARRGSVHRRHAGRGQGEDVRFRHRRKRRGHRQHCPVSGRQRPFLHGGAGLLSRPRFLGQGLCPPAPCGRHARACLPRRIYCAFTPNPFARNAASCRVLEKAGFQLEGTLRKNAVKNGEALDMKLYALVREEDTHAL